MRRTLDDRVLEVAGAREPALSQAIAGAEPAKPGADAAVGLSGYYAIQESLLAVSTCKRFPGAKAQAKEARKRPFRFWRSDTSPKEPTS